MERSLKRPKLPNLKKDFIDLVQGISFKDILIFLLFPIIITYLMFLPAVTRESLSLHIYNPQWWQFFTNAFIHKDFNHLWYNIQGYFVFGTVIFIFANKIKEKRSLFLLFLLTFISLPLINSIIEIKIDPIFLPRIKTSEGSSGIISAMLGFFPMFWIYYFSKKTRTNLINRNFLNISILYVVLLFTIVYYSVHKNLLFIFLWLSLFCFFIFSYRKNFKFIFVRTLEEPKENIIFYFLIIMLPILFMFAPLLLFPTRVIQEDSFVDFIIHYIDLILGIIISFNILKKPYGKKRQVNSYHESKETLINS